MKEGVHGKHHPQDMGGAEVEAFLMHLAVDRQVSVSTQNRAKAALLYLCQQVLGVDFPWLGADKKPVSALVLRHVFATHSLQASDDIRTVQEWLGRADLSTASICAHI